MKKHNDELMISRYSSRESRNTKEGELWMKFMSIQLKNKKNKMEFRFPELHGAYEPNALLSIAAIQSPHQMYSQREDAAWLPQVTETSPPR